MAEFMLMHVLKTTALISLFKGGVVCLAVNLSVGGVASQSVSLNIEGGVSLPVSL